MSNNKGAKIVAFIALFMIIFSVIGSGVLFLYETNKNSSGNKLSESQLNELLKSFSGSNIGTGEVQINGNETLSGSDILNLTKTGTLDN